jgi:hypothetical protein
LLRRPPKAPSHCRYNRHSRYAGEEGGAGAKAAGHLPAAAQTAQPAEEVARATQRLVTLA